MKRDYKKAYLIMQEYSIYLPEELHETIDKKLAKVGL
jgi:hypothetical protein